MLVLLLLAASAAAVRHDQTPLRSECESGAAPVATLAAGHPVRIRFSIAGGTPCYKLSALVDGREVTGYLNRTELTGLEEFDGARQSAAAVAAIGNIQAHAAAGVQGASGVSEALAAIDASEPARALDLLRPLLGLRPDPDLLALAGVAAWRNDEPRAALEYWRRSLSLRPDPRIEQLCRTVEREAAGDRSSGRIYGLRVLLRFEPGAVAPELARAMVGVLDGELERVSNQLGCATRERLVAVVQSREAYLASTGAAEWSGGRYDGRIRIALLEEHGLGPRTRRVFAHEIVHACLANLGRYPAWLHEGLAQWLSGDRLGDAERLWLGGRIRGGAFPKLDDLGRNLGSMDAQAARGAYALALEAASMLMAEYGGLGIRNVLANPALLAQITGELNRKLGL